MRQPPCAAASSSSGLVLPPGSPTREAREKGSRANAPLSASSVPAPRARFPSQPTCAVRSMCGIRRPRNGGGGAVGVVGLGRRAGRPEDAEHLHLARAVVLEAVDEPGGQVDARAGAQRRARAVDMEGAFSREHVHDLVVLVEVVGCASGRDVAAELRHRLAAVLRVREQRELASRRCRAAVAARDHRVARRRGQRLLDEHGQKLQAVGRLDLPGRPARDEDAGPRLERQLVAADRRHPAALEDVEHLVALVVAVLVASPVEAQQALPELGNGEERRDLRAGLVGLDAVAHRASLYGCMLFLCRV